jgi:hypothetical protein
MADMDGSAVAAVTGEVAIGEAVGTDTDIPRMAEV